MAKYMISLDDRLLKAFKVKCAQNGVTMLQRLIELIKGDVKKS